MRFAIESADRKRRAVAYDIEVSRERRPTLAFHWVLGRAEIKSCAFVWIGFDKSIGGDGGITHRATEAIVLLHNEHRAGLSQYWQKVIPARFCSRKRIDCFLQAATLVTLWRSDCFG